VQRIHEFRLLYEQWNPDDTVHLRASEHAVNVLIDALDMDVESAQIAAEAQMNALLARGALDSAVEIARRAVYLTVQYLEQIRSILRDTQMDVDTWDWADSVPTILARSLDHITERIANEARLLAGVEERRDNETDPVNRQRANEFVRLLRRCHASHLDLQRHLIGAREVRREAQDDRFRRARGSLRRVDLEADVLVSLLGAPTATVHRWCAGVFERMAALRPVLPVALAVLLDELFDPPSEPDEGELDEDPIFDDVDVEPWWTAYEELVEGLLADMTEPIQLSDLFDRGYDSINTSSSALEGNRTTAALCHAAHALLTTNLNVAVAGERVLVALPTGNKIDGYPIDADDLLLVPAAVHAEASAGDWPAVDADFLDGQHEQ
jgi:hypothetical protein